MGIYITMKLLALTILSILALYLTNYHAERAGNALNSEDISVRNRIEKVMLSENVERTYEAASTLNPLKFHPGKIWPQWSSDNSTALPARTDERLHCRNANNDDNPKPASEVLTDIIELDVIAASKDVGVGGTWMYRCMDGYIYYCNTGMNIICGKAEVTKAKQAVKEFWRNYPDTKAVPMSETGHATIHTWACVGTKPRIISSEPIDRRGFNSNRWHKLD